MSINSGVPDYDPGDPRTVADAAGVMNVEHSEPFRGKRHWRQARVMTQQRSKPV